MLTGPAAVGKTCVCDAVYASGDKARREQTRLGINFIVDLKAGRPFSFLLVWAGHSLRLRSGQSLSDAFDF
jgi:hypothetical protein